MKLNINIKWIALLGLAIGAILWFALATPKEDAVVSRIRAVRKNPPQVQPVDEEILRDIENIKLPGGGDGGPDLDKLTNEQLVALLRKYYGNRIRGLRGQLAMIEDLIRHLHERWGGNFEENVYKLIKQAFPDMADEIYAKFESLEKYNGFLRDYYANRAGLSDEEAFTQLWDKRREIFGVEEANQMWQSELWDHSLKQSLQSIDSGERGVSINEKLQSYSKAIYDTYGDRAEWYKGKHTINMVNNFLNLPSVQSELRGMEEGTLRTTLREVRREMGLKDDALDRLDRLDRTRDDRWKNGRDYMKERDALAKQFKGEALESKLDDARRKYLGNEWDVVKSEEASGYFRFKDQRLLGVN